MENIKRPRNRSWLILIFIILCLMILSQTISAYTFPESKRTETRALDLGDITGLLFWILLIVIVAVVIVCILFFIENIRFQKLAEEQLLKGEKVLAKYHYFFATNQRLLRLQSSKNFGIVEYNKISKITCDKYGLGKVLRSIAIFCGLLLFIVGFISYVGLEIRFDPTHVARIYSDPFTSLICFFDGILCIGLGLIPKKYYYQIWSTSFDDKESKRWKMQKTKSSERLINIAKEHGNTPIEKIKL